MPISGKLEPLETLWKLIGNGGALIYNNNNNNNNNNNSHVSSIIIIIIIISLVSLLKFITLSINYFLWF